MSGAPKTPRVRKRTSAGPKPRARSPKPAVPKASRAERAVPAAAAATEPSDAMKTLGERLQWAREFRGVQVQQLATALKVVRQTIGRLEKGTYLPSLEMIETAAKTLDVDVAWLTFGRGTPFALPEVKAYLHSKRGQGVPPEVAEWLSEHSHRLFRDVTPTDAEIEFVELLIARLLRLTPQNPHGDRS